MNTLAESLDNNYLSTAVQLDMLKEYLILIRQHSATALL